MKKWLLISLLLILGVFLASCNSNNEEIGEAESEEKKTFTNSDIEKTNEMIDFLNEKMREFENKANNAIESGQIKIGDNERLIEEIQGLGQESVIQPFLEKYPNSLISKNEEDSSIPITVEPTSSESCTLGNCTYEKINVIEVDFDTDKSKEYHSRNFKITQLIFDNVKTLSKVEGEIEEAELRFVKTKDNNLVITSIPNIQLQTLYIDEVDSEYESIATDVPESEVEAEQAEYKKEVEETLAKFPKLQ